MKWYLRLTAEMQIRDFFYCGRINMSYGIL